MKILCIGKTGQVARALQERLSGYEVDLKCLGRPEADLTHPERLHDIIKNAAPALVINAAAFTNVDKAESATEEAFAVNAAGPGRLAEACADLQLPMIHISTDYVFSDSTERPLLESDPVRGINAYGRSKAAGEAAVRDVLRAHIILRTSWVYSPFGANFVKTMLRLAAERGSVSVVDDQIGAPTSAFEIAEAIFNIARKLLSSVPNAEFGTYHFASKGYVSWADVASFIFQLHDSRTGCKTHLKRIPSSDYPTPAQRPRNSRLDTRKITATFGINPRDWKHGVEEVVNRLLNEKAENA
ncbi:MAG: dTDP-4-dehydrorhamnose reductase [Pseudomonadota bacterium]